MVAWLLLLLAEGESYGRALIVDLSGRGIRADSPFVYRTLRGLEQERAISSRWARSAHGPRRRAYRITRKGRRILGEVAVDIAAACEMHKTFLRAHEHAQSAGDAGGGEHLALGELREPPTRQNAGSDDPSAGPRDRRGSPSRDAAAAVGRELLTAWLLLLLRHRASYGYVLRSALEANHIHADPATLYRLLRSLDRDGRLQSRWRSSPAGPQQRLYRLTSEGERHLDELASAVAAIRDDHAAFLQAYQHSAGEPGRRR